MNFVVVIPHNNLFIDHSPTINRLQQVRHEDANVHSALLAAAALRKEHLIFPIFASDAHGTISAMPGMPLTPVNEIALRAQEVTDIGISSVILFGISSDRDARGSMAASAGGVVQRAIREIRSAFGSSINIVTDVCVCQYNNTGHCGLLRDGRIDNDSTLEVLSEIAMSHAEAGADVVAPSSMMDGQVHAIRTALADRGLSPQILSYSAKHASSLYSPFRSAAFAKPTASIDKSSYQVSYANPRQVMMEVQTDIAEGADMVMIKPALAYLDLVTMVKDRFAFPVAVQNVSGEYAMIKAAAARGWINEEEWKVKTLASIKRAGADRIISYFAIDVAKYL
jgi:porphobilinogen synthase